MKNNNQEPLDVELSSSEIDELSSHYLKEGRKQESWRIESAKIYGKNLNAVVAMQSVYVSESDLAGFHLTIFSALEFLSQLMIVYAHVWAGLAEKTREAWMVESSTRIVRAIRHAARIEVKMTVRSMRNIGGKLYCVADYCVTDNGGGLFEVELKGFLS